MKLVLFARAVADLFHKRLVGLSFGHILRAGSNDRGSCTNQRNGSSTAVEEEFLQGRSRRIAPFTALVLGSWLENSRPRFDGHKNLPNCRVSHKTDSGLSATRLRLRLNCDGETRGECCGRE